MKKSVYSIVLMDHVVEAIDELAAREGTSRSNLINRILAEHVSCTTPEMRMQSVFSEMERRMNDLFRIESQASDAMFSVQSVLKFRYRPSLRYSVELLREPTENQLGWLKISCRTQSRMLLPALEMFYRMWADAETAAYPQFGRMKNMYVLAPAKMTRAVLRIGDMSAEETGEAICRYINMFDAMIKQYFTELQSGMSADALCECTMKRLVSLFREEKPLI